MFKLTSLPSAPKVMSTSPTVINIAAPPLEESDPNLSEKVVDSSSKVTISTAGKKMLAKDYDEKNAPSATLSIPSKLQSSNHADENRHKIPGRSGDEPATSPAPSKNSTKNELLDFTGKILSKK